MLAFIIRIVRIAAFLPHLSSSWPKNATWSNFVLNLTVFPKLYSNIIKIHAQICVLFLVDTSNHAEGTPHQLLLDSVHYLFTSWTFVFPRSQIWKPGWLALRGLDHFVLKSQSSSVKLDSTAVSISVGILVELTNIYKTSICQFNQYIYIYWDGSAVSVKCIANLKTSFHHY